MEPRTTSAFTIRLSSRLFRSTSTVTGPTCWIDAKSLWKEASVGANTVSLCSAPFVTNPSAFKHCAITLNRWSLQPSFTAGKATVAASVPPTVPSSSCTIKEVLKPRSLESSSTAAVEVAVSVAAANSVAPALLSSAITSGEVRLSAKWRPVIVLDGCLISLLKNCGPSILSPRLCPEPVFSPRFSEDLAARSGFIIRRDATLRTGAGVNALFATTACRGGKFRFLFSVGCFFPLRKDLRMDRSRNLFRDRVGGPEGDGSAAPSLRLAVLRLRGIR